MTDSEEQLDLVNANDQVVGNISRSDSNNLPADSGQFIRCISAFIMRANGDVWIPTRSPHKRIAPDGLDYGCGGYVTKGETYAQALMRELAEETGLVPDSSELQLVSKHRLPGTPPFFEALYIVHSDEHPKLSDEHVSGTWMSLNDLHAAIASGAPTKSSMPGNVARLQAFKGVRYEF